MTIVAPPLIGVISQALYASAISTFRNGGFRALNIRVVRDAGFHLWYATLSPLPIHIFPRFLTENYM